MKGVLRMQELYNVKEQEKAAAAGQPVAWKEVVEVGRQEKELKETPQSNEERRVWI